MPLDKESVMKKKYAVIEIGTRGIRLLIAEANKNGIKEIIHSSGDLSELGNSVDAKGNISQRAINHVAKIVDDYVSLAETKGATDIFAVATEVVRAAPNRNELGDILSKTVDFKILTNEEESLYSFIATVDAFRDHYRANYTLATIDQGGGSTELTIGTVDENGDITLDEIYNLNLGTIMLSRIFLDDKDLGKGFNRTRQKIKEELSKYRISTKLLHSKNTMAVGLGSSLTSYARGLLAQQTGSLPQLYELHGKVLDVATMDKKIKDTEPALKGKTPKDFGNKLTKDSDLTTLVSGILTYHEILKLYHIDKIYLSRNGMRYGALLWLAGMRCGISKDIII